MIVRKITVIDPAETISSDFDREMKIYLLVTPGHDPRQTLAFKSPRSGEVFTFGFSSTEKLTAFVRYQQQQGRLGYLGNQVVSRWVTLREYISNATNTKLNLDPPKDFLNDLDFDLPNLN